MFIAYIQEYNNMEGFGKISLSIFKLWLVFIISNVNVPKIYARDADKHCPSICVLILDKAMYAFVYYNKAID